MDVKTRNALLSRAGATASLPTTRAGIDKRLEAIGAGRGLHKPTAAHPYRDCFASTDRYGSTRLHRHSETVPMEFEGRSYDRAITCAEYIAMCEASKNEARSIA